MLHCSWIGPRLSSQLPIVGSAPGEAGSPQPPAHTAADAGADEREDEAEEDNDNHNSRNYSCSKSAIFSWLIAWNGGGRKVKEASVVRGGYKEGYNS